MGRNTSIIVSIILISYFLFTSGFVFEVSKSEVTASLDLPWNVGLSGQRMGTTPIATQNDIQCIKWLQKNWNGKDNVITDYNARNMLGAYVPVYFYLYKNYRSENKTVMPFLEIPDKCYIFLTSWNVEHGEFVEPTFIGLRQAYPLPELDYPVLYSSGKAEILGKGF